MSLSGDNVDILGDMYYKFLVHDCMWSGTCKEDNTHETTNKFSDFSYFSTSPVYGSIFDIFNIDDENSLGEINCDPEYDTSDQDDVSPLCGLSPEDTEVGVDETVNLLTPSCSSSPTPSTSSSTSTLTSSSTIITPAGLVADASSSIIKPTTSTSRATLTGKSASTIKSTLSSKATKSASSKANSTTKSTISAAVAAVASTSTIRATTLAATNSLVTPTISPIATVTTSVLNSPTATIPTTSSTGGSAAAAAAALTATVVTGITPATSTTTSILKSTGKPRNPKSLYPERRKEHNNSEKKRRDHLRNAFNHLRDQIPKLKDGEKKAARVTILKESVSYVTLLKEKHRYLERTKNAETIKHENLLKRLKMLQSSTGASSFINNNINNINTNNDSNIYVQCNSSTVC